ncbi:MAG: phage terminase large subunit [Rhodospirillaceae bacterium]|nr:phage terminase large subunit [Rhodospirillaceae bacterium]
MNQIKIEYVQNLHPIFTKEKRIKIIVGGRGSSKSTGVADYVAAKVSSGELWCCARETQNSIEESVHRTLLEEIERLGIYGFEDTKTGIKHLDTGGRTFYRGLSRNITALKSTLSGIDGLWIEEGEDISHDTLRVLTASVRLNATDTARKIAGEEVKLPEIIITMNRGTRAGAIAEKWLARAERDLGRCGFYEDENIMVVEMNYTDMPKGWFLESGLESERRDDEEKMSRAEYDHKWGGAYLDEIEGTIIKTEWFDAAIDAHLKPNLVEVFKPHGSIIASHDPFDDGNDAGGFATRHGSIITQVDSKTSGEIDEVCDWATGLAIAAGADWFTWDGDGMGTGLKRQVALAFEGTKTKYHIFKGSLSGLGQDNAKRIYMPEGGDKDTKPKNYAQTFKNNRAQYYSELARRFFNTYNCVVKGKYVDPDDMISLASAGIEDMTGLRTQLCRIPRKPNGTGLVQIMSKVEMAKLKISSPNEGDAVMMSLFSPTEAAQFKGLDFDGWNG